MWDGGSIRIMTAAIRLLISGLLADIRIKIAAEIER